MQPHALVQSLFRLSLQHFRQLGLSNIVKSHREYMWHNRLLMEFPDRKGYMCVCECVWPLLAAFSHSSTAKQSTEVSSNFSNLINLGMFSESQAKVHSRDDDFDYCCVGAVMSISECEVEASAKFRFTISHQSANSTPSCVVAHRFRFSNIFFF